MQQKFKLIVKDPGTPVNNTIGYFWSEAHFLCVIMVECTVFEVASLNKIHTDHKLRQ